MQNLWKVPALMLALAGLLFAGGMLADATVEAEANSHHTVSDATPPCIEGWRIYRRQAGFAVFFSVSGTSPSDIWAVGEDGGSALLIEHWDGTSWSTVKSKQYRPNSALYDVVAIAHDDVWAVGYYTPIPESNQRLFLVHWNGAEWTEEAAPDPVRTGTGQLFDVDATASDDVWAVGIYEGSPVSLHWNGTDWNSVPITDPGPAVSDLHGVSIVSPNDVWAVGRYGSDTLILHWDGASWSTQTTSFSGILLDVDGSSSTDQWAVGDNNGSNLILHWDGNTWMPIPGLPNNIVPTSVSVVSANEVWVIGRHRTFRWDGATWREVYMPGGGNGQLMSRGGFAVGSPGGDAWVVGYVNGSIGDDYAAIYHYVGQCPSFTPTPTTCQTGWTVIDSPNRGITPI
jgi:hypothetical protein